MLTGFIPKLLINLMTGQQSKSTADKYFENNNPVNENLPPVDVRSCFMSDSLNLVVCVASEHQSAPEKQEQAFHFEKLRDPS